MERNYRRFPDNYKIEEQVVLTMNHVHGSCNYQEKTGHTHPSDYSAKFRQEAR